VNRRKVLFILTYSSVCIYEPECVFIYYQIFRGHIESLPEILNEIWAVMGESGEAVRKSLVWIIETVSFSFFCKRLQRSEVFS
jgi:hypothetical protein